MLVVLSSHFMPFGAEPRVPFSRVSQMLDEIKDSLVAQLFNVELIFYHFQNKQTKLHSLRY